MTAFAERLQKIAAETSTLCLGLDPSPGLLAAWELPDSAAGAREFCRRALDAAQGLIGIVKPQAAFYERFGATGVAVLDEVVAEIRDRGQLSIVDCKRGDVAHTMVAYCQGLKGNAMTLTAYLGFAALHDGLGELMAKGAGAFVVVRSSNPEGSALQRARLESGVTVAEHLCDEITSHNRELDTGAKPGPIGAVIGATLEDEALALVERLPLSYILAPGVGAQGATLGDLKSRFGGHLGRLVPTASRSLVGPGPDIAAMRRAMATSAEEWRRLQTN
jgi:orotidine-5'-phosphate decarboxylase